MTTMTTKQMRENMPEVIRLLKSGNPVRITYRSKPVGTIEPETSSTPRRGSAEAVRKGLAALKMLDVPDSVRNDRRSMKDQLAELRESKYGK